MNTNAYFQLLSYTVNVQRALSFTHPAKKRQMEFELYQMQLLIERVHKPEKP
jgi:hypothetical protein